MVNVKCWNVEGKLQNTVFRISGCMFILADVLYVQIECITGSVHVICMFLYLLQRTELVRQL
jgi:hypothetical protein